eukprot:TRINITY_DN2032_c0_g2_i1.p1 TRINITY_DN2032_c0_g2~~TRINITY_DN2032_c0_g2_i1.p1  ORF type:complete len:246 (-),score=53.07 TRINITY_DN2032_c0_g2_i1:46-717(-)
MAKVSSNAPKWLARAQELDKAAVHSQGEWYQEVDDRLGRLMQKPILGEAVDALLMQIQKQKMTEIQLFEAIDTNGDGELSKTEIQTALRKLGVSLPPSELDAIVRIFDTDGNGTIDFSEFFYLLQQKQVSRSKDTGSDGADVAYDPLYGFRVGETAKCLINVSFKDMGTDPYEKVSRFVTIIGPALKKGIIFVKFQTASDAVFGVRFDQLGHVGGQPKRKSTK